MIKIYCLINPINNSVFYVGATTLSLRIRLSGHCTKSNNGSGTKEKTVLIKSIRKNKMKPIIECISEVPLHLADHCEKLYYKYFKHTGNEMLQNGYNFSYVKSKRKHIRKIERKLNKPA